jgi:hypothetical protein
MRRGAAWLGLALLAGCAAVEDPPPSVVEEARAPILLPPPRAGLFAQEWEDALARIHLPPDGGRCSKAELAAYSSGSFRTTLYESLQNDPTLTDRWSRVLRESALHTAPTLEGAAMFAAGRLNASVRLTLLGDPLKEAVVAARATGALRQALLDAGAVAVPDPDVAGVPTGVQAAAALVIGASLRAEKYLERAGVRGAGEAHLKGADATLLLSTLEGDAEEALMLDFERRVAALDAPWLSRGAVEVLLAVDRARQWLRDELEAAPRFSWRCSTTKGGVELRGVGSDDADSVDDGGEPWLLRVDLGGDDHWRDGGATDGASDGTCAVSVLIDMGGNDRYEGRENTLAFGAGFFGVGIVLDDGGDDVYSLSGPRSAGLGAGCFGFGVLLDAAGNDRFEGDAFCQGAAAAGVGALVDLGGEDRYRAFTYAQGFAFVKGSGLLVDLSGNDVYIAEPIELRRPSPQSKDHNLSLAQGFGYGLRADYRDGHSLAGGVGLLVDGAGNDRYSCGVFGQGGGYWMGVGMLLEGGGDDVYDGVWYVQGASAHFAIGLLEDASGNDSYKASLNMAQGAGHDFSVGALLDRAGDDSHEAPNLSLGAGNDNGVGLFVDVSGTDHYRSKGVTLGGASLAMSPETPSLRHGALTLGMFFDLGGEDTYEGNRQGPANGVVQTWKASGSPDPMPNERGVFVDR